MTHPDDTTAPRVSLTSAPGRGGLAILILRGEGAEALLARVGLRPPKREGRLKLGILREEGAAIDEVLVARVATQPPTFEIGVHGGPAAVAGATRALVQQGAQRAHALCPEAIGGASDRLAAAAARALPLATCELAAQLLLRALNGELAAALRDLANELRAQRSDELSAWEQRAAWGQRLLSPPRVVLIGAPNAGKSTLFNALVGSERAIVSGREGTTRDVIEGATLLRGWPILLSDTAGLRITEDGVEAEGQTLALRAAREADLIIEVVDIRGSADAPPPSEGGSPPRLRALTKRDLVEAAPAPGWPVSALTSAGLDELRDAAWQLLFPGAPASLREPALFDEAQVTVLREARRRCEDGRWEDAAAALEALLEPAGSLG